MHVIIRIQDGNERNAFQLIFRIGGLCEFC